MTRPRAVPAGGEESEDGDLLGSVASIQAGWQRLGEDAFPG